MADNNKKTSAEDEDQSHDRYCDQIVISAEDPIREQLLPEQRKSLEEFVANSDQQKTDKQSEDCSQMRQSSNESTQSFSFDFLNNYFINKSYTKEQQQKLAQMILEESDDDSSVDSTENLSKTPNKVEEQNEDNCLDCKIRKLDGHIDLPDRFKTQQKINFTEQSVPLDQPSNGTHLNSQIEDNYDQLLIQLQTMSEELSKRQIWINDIKRQSTFGYICVGCYRDSRQIAIKVIDSKINKNKGFVGNSFALNHLKHQNIIEIIHLLVINDLLFVLMPEANTDLFDYIKKTGPLIELTAKSMFKQIGMGLNCIHQNEWAHRDVKLENCLLIGRTVKICDFDLLTKVINHEPMACSQRAGTLVYMAPELLRGKGSSDLRICDVWSFGVLCFAAVTTYYPFGHIEDVGIQLDSVLKNMRYKRHCYPTNISIQCKKFINNILEYDPMSRPTMDLILKEEWLKIH